MDPSAPFDEFALANPKGQSGRSNPLMFALKSGLRGISLTALWVAMPTAIVIVGWHLFRAFAGTEIARPGPLKIAIPLIAVGVSYISLMITAPRTAAQRILGLFVGAAFVLWGLEQYLRNPMWVAFIDDLVVLVFVFDLSLVIRRNLARSSKRRREMKQAGTGNEKKG